MIAGSGSGSGSGSDEMVSFSHGNCTEDKSVFLPYHSFTISKDLPIIVIQLGFIDLNRLNELTDLATATNNTYVSLTNTAFHDMNRNQLIPIYSDNATQTDHVFYDVTPPQLVFFDLNMTSEVLSLTFDEVVRTSTFNVERITLQSFKYVPMVSILNWYQLTGGDISYIDDHIVHVQLTINDLNAIKYLIEIASTLNNTYLTFTSDLVEDMHGNMVTPVVNGQGYRVGCFVEDIIKPTLTQFHLDLDAQLLYLTFSETINVTSFDVTQVTLQDYRTDMMNRTRQLTSESSHSPDPTDTTVIVVTLGYSDINRIKSIEMFATHINDTWIIVTDDLILDMNDNPNVAIINREAQVASNYTKDVTSPYLIEYHIDFINEIMTLHFNEPVNATTISYGLITLQDQIASNHNYTLTGGTAEAFDDALTIVISFNYKDITYLKMHPKLYTSVNDSYITYTSHAFHDTAYNSILPLVNTINATQASSFIYYSPPVFTSVRPRSGRESGGTLLTIIGDNFGPVEGERGSRQVDVLIDFVLSPNTTVISSNTTLEAIAPEAKEEIIGVPVTLTITVDNSSLMINISDEYTYLAPPVITRIYPTIGTIFGGTLVTIYGENFGQSTASGEGPVVSVAIGNETCTNVNVISNYTLTCITPELDDGIYNVSITVDDVTSDYNDTFEYLVPPEITDVNPPSTYKSTPTLVTIYGRQFGPTTLSNDSKPIEVYITSMFNVSECTNVTVTVEDTELTCVMQPNLGPSNITVVVDEIDSNITNVTFFHFDDAGNFSFQFKEFFISETELYGNVTVIRHDYPLFASPANITVLAMGGTALSPFQFIAQNISRWLPYPDDTVDFPIRITARTYEPRRIRKGADDDVFINVRITSIAPMFGEAHVVESTSILTIKAICEAVTHLCIADWDVNENAIIYYRMDELP
jgi:hypothetical protein